FFSEAGLIHLLVVSGAQISLLSMVVLSICKLFRAPFILSFFVILILQGFYLIIAGVDPSILRAIVMTDLILWHRYYSLIAFPFWWYLWVAAIIVICIIPKAVLFPGFWYSFTITFGLLYLLPKIVGNVFGPKKVINYILASFTAVFFALPIQLIQTQTIQPMSLISNLWATWLSSLILLSSAVVMIIEPIVPYITDIISSVVIMMIDVLIVLSKNIKPWIIAIPKPLNLCFSLVFILPLVMINFSRFKYFFLLITILFFMYSVHLIQKRQMLISLDVGQGDATLILDGFSSVLIDTGGLGQSQAMARTHILPVLRYYGINELDLVIITHHDLDHLGGLKDIIGYGVRQIYSPESLPYNHHLTLTSPLGLDLNSMKLNLFPVGYILPKLNSNNHGIVVSVDALRASFLITGDIDQETELRLIQVGFIDQHTFLKLGHHGSISSTSSELLDVVQPLFVWNSCGFNNRFGHPNPAVIDRLNYRNIPFLSTHESGAIFFDLNSKVMIRSALSNDSFKLKQGVGL
ncbi:MAG: ComEC/Rec2 family competence protein, partial [Candidatus Margulisiibacteriota bacterium]